MLTVLGTIGIVAVTVVVGMLADRRWSLMPRKEDLIAAGKPKPLLPGHLPGEAPGTAIEGSPGEIEKLRRRQRCPRCRTEMTANADDTLTFGGRELRVLRFTCPRCATHRGIYVVETRP